MYNFVRGFRRAYKQGALYPGGLIVGLKKHFKKSFMAVLIKILPEFSALLSKKKNQIHSIYMLVVGSGLLSRWLIIMGRIFFVVDR